MNILCKHKKLKTLVVSLSLQQITEVGVVATQERSNQHKVLNAPVKCSSTQC